MKKNEYTETILLAIPVVIGQLSNMLMIIIDNMVVGHLGKESLSAAALASNCYILIAIIGFGALNPIPAVVAEARGAENENDVKQLLRASMYAGLVQGVGVGLLVYVSSWFIPYLGQPEADVNSAIPFMWILAISTIPACVFTATKGFFDGMERTNVGMIISIFGLFLNTFLNIGLVFGKFGFPTIGLIGSAWATLISRTIMMIVMLVVVYLNKTTKPLLYLQQFDYQYLIKLIRLGIPMGLQLFFEVAAFAGAVIVIGWLPDASVNRSAHQIAMNMASGTFTVMLGISVAGSVRVGEAFGRKDKKGVWEAGKAAMLVGLVVMVACALLLIIFRKDFASLYGMEDEAVQAVTIRLIIIAAIFQIFDGAQCVGSGLLRGVQDVKLPAMITFAAYILLWIPLSYWLAFKMGYGVDGVWYAFVVALGFAAATLNWRFYYLTKTTKNDI